MKTIPLTQGQTALVDDDDYAKLSVFKWFAHKTSDPRLFYAERRVGSKGVCNMQTAIMGKPPRRGLTLDHWDGNGLNNQKENLRWSTKGQQRQNTRLAKNNKIGLKGVRRLSDNRVLRPWQACIRVDGKTLFLGNFAAPESAAIAYNEAAKRHFGEFAWTNPISL